MYLRISSVSHAFPPFEPCTPPFATTTAPPFCHACPLAIHVLMFTILVLPPRWTMLAPQQPCIAPRQPHTPPIAIHTWFTQQSTRWIFTPPPVDRHTPGLTWHTPSQLLRLRALITLRNQGPFNRFTEVAVHNNYTHFLSLRLRRVKPASIYPSVVNTSMFNWLLNLLNIHNKSEFRWKPCKGC